ncbi:hypothetical protein C8A00DRAFT_32417 [Chaetomidium leptoderma]|uniref:Uncharacterized protein n=1 Tax=Chaetomidium leptoderma TaxID=669021 RepID=A0AAN6ZXT4_9PEZI|nr:hypothetical protein C8A00DRAFT_32417 [Chaetomidium leptoderma]
MLPIRSKPKRSTTTTTITEESPQNNPGLGPALHWRLKRTSIDALLAEGGDGPTIPHVVVTGNSLRGSHRQYTDLVKASLLLSGDSSSGSSSSPRPANTLPHHTTGEKKNLKKKKNGEPSSSSSSSPSSSSCAENETHVGEFLRADHDRLARACFAAHCAYLFPLAGAGADGVAFVETAMDAWAGDKERVRAGVTSSPAAMWRASRAEADTLGTGTESMHLFRWQHVCSESKGRLGWLLESR